MTTPTSHGATEPHPVSEGLTDALEVPRGWATASQKVLVLYSPLDIILPFHPLCPKSEHWGPVALTCLPSMPATLEGRKGPEHSPDPPYVGPAVGVCDLPRPPTSSSTIPFFTPSPPLPLPRSIFAFAAGLSGIPSPE